MPASNNTINVLEHKRLVATYMEEAIRDLVRRATMHDDSKFEPEEFDLYEEALPKFEKTVYGSDEYIQICRDIKPAIRHHITSNRHHPEYFGDKGVNGMTLVDLVEMTCDWIAASLRNGGSGDVRLDLNKERFGIGDQLLEIIKNTIEDLLM
jgi:hypothetical protein